MLLGEKTATVSGFGSEDGEGELGPCSELWFVDFDMCDSQGGSTLRR